MTKSQAISAFGTVANLAGALGISRQAVYKWPERLHQDCADRIVGAAIRTRRDLGLLGISAHGALTPPAAAANSATEMRSAA
ncbi:Cro/CI family transcriptional regulator [Flagellatimonas centrodinii]|uniref:Cro/CI family transcriptional regulator n=1 Tax=Flagellatimonas centrodinii TaxID=2806210 RepID=UPI001EFB1313|nr:Cro/CI family transcriptional regulator [Flagellatimonas centrodinii]ULQ45951.1 Cro/CI family transcriptional regulator [Flagellatimonas centrodinii]